MPEDHLLHRIYEFVEDLYSEDNERKSIDPVVLFKIVLNQHIYGNPSLRWTLRRGEDEPWLSLVSGLSAA